MELYYSTLHSARLDGSRRVQHVSFTPSHGAPRSPVLFPPSNGTDANDIMRVNSGVCLHLAACMDALWCATRHALLRLPRRTFPPPIPRHYPAVSAIGPLPLTRLPHSDENQCDATTLWVRAGTCLCPEGTVAEHAEKGASRRCVAAPPTSPPECIGGCGAGRCVNGACECGSLFKGARCQHYRCAHYCLHRGRCHLDPTPSENPLDQSNTNRRQPPLKCTCPPAWTGARCERPTNNTPGVDICDDYCLNQGTCSVHAAAHVSCVCPMEWTGDRCELPVDEDTEKQCDGWCANGGRCVAGVGPSGQLCVCGPSAWGGERCTQYVGHDHACAALTCAPPTACVYRPASASGELGAVYCACVQPSACATAENIGAPTVAWATSLGAALLLGATLGALFLVRRRKRGVFGHRRLADNLEINNPMYLPEEADSPAHLSAIAQQEDSFDNPVYHETVYSMQQPPQLTDECANLLQETDEAAHAAPDLSSRK